MNESDIAINGLKELIKERFDHSEKQRDCRFEQIEKIDDDIRGNGGKVGINARLIFLEKLKNWILGIIAILATDFARHLLHSLFFVVRKIDENRPVS